MAKRDYLMMAVCFLCACFLWVPSAAARSPWASEITYMDKVGGKFTSGAKNVLLGWAEPFREASRANKFGENAILGFGRGIVKGGANMLIGLVHVVTTPVPEIYMPMVDGGTDLL